VKSKSRRSRPDAYIKCAIAVDHFPQFFLRRQRSGGNSNEPKTRIRQGPILSSVRRLAIRSFMTAIIELNDGYRA